MASEPIITAKSSDLRYTCYYISLHILPLMMTFEFNNIMFFITCLKNPTASFSILDYVSFCLLSTRSTSHHKVIQQQAKSNNHRHLYFLHFLICHFLLVLFHVSLNLSCGLPFSIILILICTARIISFAHACCKCASEPPLSQFSPQHLNNIGLLQIL